MHDCQYFEEYSSYSILSVGIFFKILSRPQNIAIDLNNVVTINSYKSPRETTVHILNKSMNDDGGVITLFKCIKVFYGTDNIQIECQELSAKY